MDFSKIQPMKPPQDFDKLIGGLDTRIAFQEEQENPSMIFWSDAQNVEVFNGLLRKMNGCTNTLTTALGVPILGAHNFFVASKEYLVFNAGDGHFYLYDGFGGKTSKKSGLDSTAKCQYTQFFDKIVCCNGVDEVFGYDLTTDAIVVSNLSTQAQVGTSPKGYCCASYLDRLFIADGPTLYYSAIGDMTEWRNLPNDTPPKTGGYIQQAGWGDSDIIECIYTSKSYLVVQTNRQSYIISSVDGVNFISEPFDNKGVASRFGIIEHDRNAYFLSPQNLGVYAFGKLTDIGSFTVLDPITRRITSTLAGEIDTTNLKNTYIVSNPGRNQFWMYVPTIDGLLQKAYIFDFNYHSPNTQVPDFIPIFARLGNPITCAFTYNNKVYTGTANGQIQEEDAGLDFSGNVLDWFVYLPYMSFDSKSMYKRCSDVKLWVSTTRVNKFNIAISYNQNSWKRKIKAVNIPIPDNYFILDSTLVDSTQLLELADEKSKRIGMGKEFTSVQLGFLGSSADSDDIALRSLSFIGVNLISRV